LLIPERAKRLNIQVDLNAGLALAARRCDLGEPDGCRLAAKYGVASVCIKPYAVKRAAEKPKNPAEEISLAEARAIRPDIKEGETVEVDLPSDTLGRIAAQAAKQVIVQKVRGSTA